MRIRNIIIGGAILSIVAGFVLGKTVVADSPAPGSESDPVVSKSYVDKAMQDRVKELEAEIVKLTTQSQDLQNTIDELQAKINKTPVKTPTTTPSTGTTTPSTGTTTPSTGSSQVGKTAYVQDSVGKINVRSGPSTSVASVGSVGPSEAMTILQVKTGTDGKTWYQITLKNGTTGWVAGWLVAIK